jgi:ACS family hexuronate transporter-like MFS transporter
MKASPWGLVALLLAATTLNYLDRQTLSILAPQLQQELGLDNRLLGILFGVFYYTYTLAQFAVGPLLDRMNLRKLYGGAVAGWSAAAGLTATAGGFGGLLFWRMLLGVAESANWPAALRLIQRALPPEKRNLANGIFTSGTSIGALLAPLLVLELSRRFGWRMAFVGVASLGLVWFAAWYLYSGKQEFAKLWHPVDTSGPKPRLVETYRSIFRLPRFWFVFGVSCLVNPCLYFLLN